MKRSIFLVHASAVTVMLMVAALGGCLFPFPQTITGTAASGLAISGGAVVVECQGIPGRQTTNTTTTTNPDGSYSATFKHAAPPCLVQVTDPATSNVYYSAVSGLAPVANVTPLTTLVLANALGQDPASAFANFDDSVAAKLTAPALSVATRNVSAALRTALNIDIGRFDPLSEPFVAGTEGSMGGTEDRWIDQLVTVLNNANVPLSVLTAALAGSANAADATTALGAIVAANHIATTTLPGCPYAASGNYLAAGPHDSVFPATIDFGTMTATLSAANLNFTIGTVSDSSGNLVPCAYTLTSSALTFSVRVSQSGVSVGGALPSATSNNPGFVPFFVQGVDVFVPAQPLTLADLPSGIYNGTAFAQSTATTNEPAENYFFQYTGSSTDPAVGSYVECPGTKICNGATGTYTLAGPNADGTFTATVGTTTFTNVYYRSVTGDIVGFNVVSNSPTWASWFQVFTKRASPFSTPVVGARYSTNYWLIVNGINSATSTFILEQEAFNPTFTVTAVNTSTLPESQTRTDQFGNTDTFDYNDPFPGMLLRPAVISASQPEWAAVTALGLSVFGSTQTGVAPSSTVPVFFGISVLTP
jgi:hypothetical protein